MIYFIVGRTGSGKKKLLSLLKQNGMPVIEKDKITDTTGIKACIISPDELIKFAKENETAVFKIIYLCADDMERKFNTVKHAQNKIKAEELFDRQDEAENESFTEFEKIIIKTNIDDVEYFADKLTGIYRYENNFSENDMSEYAEFLKFESAYLEKIINMVNILADRNSIANDTENKAKVLIDNSLKNETKSIPREYFADIVAENEHYFHEVVKRYLMISDK